MPCGGVSEISMLRTRLQRKLTAAKRKRKTEKKDYSTKRESRLEWERLQ